MIKKHYKSVVGLPLAGLLAMSLGSSMGFGQAETGQLPSDATVFELDAFVVDGIRDSIIQGMDIKRYSLQMVDSIVAEDIGKFPDNNLVEALQRVSGVQTTNRGGGEVSTVSIRGLPDVTTTINGRNIFTAAGRSVALADIPASLLRGVDVYKTRSASHIETGIAGVINIHTHRPFDFDGNRINVAVRGIYQDQASSFDPNLSALYSTRGTLNNGAEWGALVNVSYAETNYRDQSVTAGAMIPFVTENPPLNYTPYERIWPNDGRVAEDPIWQPGLESGLPFEAGSTLQMNGQPVPYVLSRDAIFASDFTGYRERPAASISLQYAPNRTAEYTFEMFYNGYRNESFNSLLFSFADWWGSLGPNPQQNITLFPGTNVVKERAFVGFPYGFTSGDLTVGKTDSFLYALGARWELTSDLTLRADASYQHSEYNETFFAQRFDQVHWGLAVDFNSGGGLPAFQFLNDPNTAVDESDLNNMARWNVAQLYDNAFRDKGDAYTLTLDADYNTNWDFLRTLNFGVRYDARNATSGQRTQDAPGLGQPLSNFPELAHVNSGFFDGRSDVPTTWTASNGYYIYNNQDEVRNIYRNTVAPDLAVGSDLRIIDNFSVDEKTTAAYVSGNYRTEIGGRILDGQAGLRYVSVVTDMDFTDLNTLVESSATAHTSKVLPSFTVRYELMDNLRLRFAYGQTLRRPGFAALNPNIIYTEDVTDIGYGTASGGNPDLAATESKNYDLSLEWYFLDSSAVYATLFRRDIDGLVVDFRRRVTYEDYDYVLSAPDNASNGKLEGIELGFVFFPELLRGFGVQASYTILDSIQDIPITNTAGEIVGTDTTPFFGVSDSSYSVVLAYENPRFSARLSYVWREDFLNNYEAALFANPLGVYRKPEQSLDLSLSFNVNRNLTLTLDATNLTDEVFQSYYEFPDTHNFGSSIYSRTVAIGARYSF